MLGLFWGHFGDPRITLHKRIHIICASIAGDTNHGGVRGRNPPDLAGQVDGLFLRNHGHLLLRLARGYSGVWVRPEGATAATSETRCQATTTSSFPHTGANLMLL